MNEKLISKIDFNKYSKDKYLLILGDYGIEEYNDKIYLVKKPKYPKTYLKCCSILKEPVLYLKLTNLFDDFKIDFNLEHFRQLLICRNAYWKIAGDEMGLGKPWKPDWTSSGQDRYLIDFNYDVLHLGKTRYGHRILLVFPTEEMRDAFYENFKDLIESCKELL